MQKLEINKTELLLFYQQKFQSLHSLTTYTLPLGDITRKYHLGFHIYADDTQIFLSFDQNNPTAAPMAIESIEPYICEIRDWVRLNKLELNDDKTDILLFSTNPQKNTSSV